jgi:hypothetical protein
VPVLVIQEYIECHSENEKRDLVIREAYNLRIHTDLQRTCRNRIAALVGINNYKFNAVSYPEDHITVSVIDTDIKTTAWETKESQGVIEAKPLATVTCTAQGMQSIEPTLLWRNDEYPCLFHPDRRFV